jgi:Tol biopolymer transport system component
MVTLAASPLPATPLTIRDGEPWIVYQGFTEGGGYGLYLVRPDGSEDHLIPTGLPDSTYKPDWSPDGRLIAFEYGQNDGEIWTMRPDGTDAKPLVTCVDMPCQWVDLPAWSPDGTELAYVRSDPGTVTGSEGGLVYVEVLDLRTGESRVVAKPAAGGAEYIENGSPRWSPDGTQIAIVVSHYVYPPADPLLGSSVAVVSADGSEAAAPRVLTDPALFGAYPDWSPDGQRIVFNIYDLVSFQDTTKAANLYTVRPDGTGLTQVTHFGENDTRATQPSWTPDGTRIIFTHISRDPDNPWGDRHIGLIDPDGSDLTVLDGQNATTPRLRPAP